MIRKSLLILAAAGSTLLPISLSAGESELLAHHIQWTGSMPAQTHYGLLTPQSVKANIADTGVIESLHIVLEMDSIDVTDLEDGKMRNKLMDHLRSDDFFAVADHPTASFGLTAHEGNEVSGTLTIRGISQPIAFPVTVQRNTEGNWDLAADFEFIRQNFNVKYQNKGFFSTAKEKLIRDEVQVEVKLTVKAAE